VSAQKSLARSGPSGVAELVRAVERFAADPPAAIRGHVVTRLEDFRSGAEERPPWLGDTPLLVLHLDSGRVLLRPSGTEPKLKIYVDLREMLAPEAAVWDAESRLTVEAVAIAADVAARLDGYGATQLR
jgi:phosphomannomutase